MYVLETIDKVLSFNVRKYRGKRSQATIADAAGLPLRTYQRYENGVLPRRRSHLVALARALGVNETALFLDPDLIKEAAASFPVTPDHALYVIRGFIDEYKKLTSD